MLYYQKQRTAVTLSLKRLRVVFFLSALFAVTQFSALGSSSGDVEAPKQPVVTDGMPHVDAVQTKGQPVNRSALRSPPTERVLQGRPVLSPPGFSAGPGQYRGNCRVYQSIQGGFIPCVGDALAASNALDPIRNSFANVNPTAITRSGLTFGQGNNWS